MLRVLQLAQLTSHRITVASLVAFSMAPQAAHATTGIASSAAGLSADLSVAGLVGASVAPIGAVSGAAAPAYDIQNTVLDVNENLSLGVLGLVSIGQSLSAGTIVTSAASVFPTSPLGNASASISNLGLVLSTDTLLGSPINILTLSATTVDSFSSVNGVNSLGVLGTTNIEGLVLSGLALGGLTIDGSAFVNPSINYQLLSVAGLSIILNEQTVLGDNTNTLSLVTNAIRIRFDNFLVSGGLLTGDIVVGQSSAAIVGGPTVEVVPEPGVWLQMIIGFGLVGAAARSRRPTLA